MTVLAKKETVDSLGREMWLAEVCVAVNSNIIGSVSTFVQGIYNIMPNVHRAHQKLHVNVHL